MDPLLREQIEYYRARASEYDQWFLRLGRYDMGPEENAQWHVEVQSVEQALAKFGARGRVLELAGGTGFWSQRLVHTANELTIVDAAPETLEINRARLGDARVRYIVADVFEWEPPEKYDVVVFTFWLSHVPPERFDAFWELVARCLARDGRVFFVDSLNPKSTAYDHRELKAGDLTVTRRLNDERQFRIYKLFYSAEDLSERLGRLGWEARVSYTPRFFLYGEARRQTARDRKLPF